MNSADTENRVASMEARVRALENELALARAALTAASSRMLADCREGMADASMPGMAKAEEPVAIDLLPLLEMSREDAAEDHTPSILLQPLPLHDVLRAKWKLGAGLPSRGFDCKCRQRVTPVVATAGKLRLFGLLEDGSPWEHIIPFSELAAEDGVLIGRDPEVSRIVLEDSSVSRAHARIEIGPLGMVVSDLNSTNGVKVNDNDVDPYHAPMPMADGSVLTLGEVPLRVEFLSD